MTCCQQQQGTVTRCQQQQQMLTCCLLQQQTVTCHCHLIAEQHQTGPSLLHPGVLVLNVLLLLPLLPLVWRNCCCCPT